MPWWHKQPWPHQLYYWPSFPEIPVSASEGLMIKASQAQQKNPHMQYEEGGWDTVSAVGDTNPPCPYHTMTPVQYSIPPNALWVNILIPPSPEGHFCLDTLATHGAAMVTFLLLLFLRSKTCHPSNW